MPRITPLIKGLITGFAMLAATLWIFYSNLRPNSPVQYLVYVIYAAGIIWTQVAYFLSDSYTLLL